MHPAVLAYLTDDTPRRLSWAKPKKESAPLPRKGVCRHCGDHIGRGIASHEKACAERDDR